LKITKLDIVVIGDGTDIDPDRGGVEPLPLLTVETDDGVTGLSEMFRVPAGVARSVLVGDDSFFGSQVLGQEIIHPEALWNRLYNNMMHSNRRGWVIRCLGALDVALWDIYGKTQGLPVYELLGGAERNPFRPEPETPSRDLHITPYATIVSDSWDAEVVLTQQIERCEQLAAQGFKAFKVEPMYSSPETAIELVRRARSCLGAEPMLAIDVGYSYDDHLTALLVAQGVEAFDVGFFETPFPVDLPDAYARLSGATRIPLAMGEHSATRFEFINMMDRGGVTVCQPYANNVGGITECKRIVDLARARGATVVPGNWSTQILGMANAHVAAYSPVTPYVEFAPASVYASPLRTEIEALGLPVKDGRMPLPSEPGIGIELPHDLIEHFTLNL